MKKFKKLSVLLAGAMMLSCVSIMPVSAEEPAASNKTLFSQDFEGDNVNPKNIAGTGATNFTTKTYSEGGGKYGSFTNTTMWRPGYDFSKDDVTSGKIKVSLDFHPVITNGSVAQGGVVIGNSYAVTSLNPQKQTLSLLWINDDGRMSTAGRLGSAASLKGKPLGIEAKDVWYTCEATLDLDTPSIDITVTDKETGDSVGRYSGNVARRGSNEWEDWPIAGTPFKNIAFICTLDVDNILVEQIVEEPTPTPAEDVTAKSEISADNGKEGYSVGLKFDQALNPSTYKNIVFKIGDEIRGGAVDDVLGHIDGEALIAIILENATSREAEVKFTNKDITID